MRQRHEGLPAHGFGDPDVVLHHRVAASKPMLGLQALKNPLGRVSLLRWRRQIRRQDSVDDRNQRTKLRFARRLRSHITRRCRKPAHLGNRISVQAKNPRCFTTALTLDKNELSDRGIKLHGIHPPPTPPS